MFFFFFETERYEREDFVFAFERESSQTAITKQSSHFSLSLIPLFYYLLLLTIIFFIKKMKKKLWREKETHQKYSTERGKFGKKREIFK